MQAEEVKPADGDAVACILLQAECSCGLAAAGNLPILKIRNLSPAIKKTLKAITEL